MKSKLLSELDSNEMQVSIGTLSMISRLLFPSSLLSAYKADQEIDPQDGESGDLETKKPVNF
ncbi:hypothetical protein DLM76_00945 [Leptospira yasudae]|uniref:hypothetical protein n=1 Tax=Leptospira yasudae TaxID=2202201 RepID=UPI000E5992D2|nr:hypothetical protein [Leptospira yasudae]RHX95593.1 hypothetical protein DLM76_00945 [Leptospira yasudae]